MSSDVVLNVECPGCSANRLDDTNIRIPPPSINVECLPTVLNELIASYAAPERKEKWKKRDRTEREQWLIFQDSWPLQCCCCWITILWLFCGLFGWVATTQVPGQMRMRDVSRAGTGDQRNIYEFRAYPVVQTIIVNGSEIENWKGWTQCYKSFDYFHKPEEILDNAWKNHWGECVWDESHGRINGAAAIWTGVSITFILVGLLLCTCYCLRCWRYPWSDSNEACLTLNRLCHSTIQPCTCAAN